MLDPKALCLQDSFSKHISPVPQGNSASCLGQIKRVQPTTEFHLLSGKIFAWKPLPKTRFSRLLKAWVEGLKENLLHQDRAGE